MCNFFYLCHSDHRCSSRGMETGSHFPRCALGAGAGHGCCRLPHGPDVFLEDGARCKMLSLFTWWMLLFLNKVDWIILILILSFLFFFFCRSKAELISVSHLDCALYTCLHFVHNWCSCCACTCIIFDLLSFVLFNSNWKAASREDPAAPQWEIRRC